MALCILGMLVAWPAAALQSDSGLGGSAPEARLVQRQRLNDRLAQMVQDGRSRLPDAAPATTGPGEATSSGRPLASPVRRTSGGRNFYRAPRLNLVTPAIVPASDLECLTQAIYYEARNESEEGQAAVAEVVMNRSRTAGYPPKVCEVVYQRNNRTCQFTFTCDGSIGRSPVNALAWSRAEAIAREVMYGGRQSLLPPSSLNYHANYVQPSWASRLERVRQIGAHIFYAASIDGALTPGAASREEPARGGGLVFTRNAALEEAYARAMQPTP